MSSTYVESFDEDPGGWWGWESNAAAINHNIWWAPIVINPDARKSLTLLRDLTIVQPETELWPSHAKRCWRSPGKVSIQTTPFEAMHSDQEF